MALPPPEQIRKISTAAVANFKCDCTGSFAISFALERLAVRVVSLGVLLVDLHDVAAKPLAECFADHTAETDLSRVVFLDKSCDLFLEFAMLRLVVD